MMSPGDGAPPSGASEMRPGDLTTLTNVKAWLSTSNYASTGQGVDPVLQQLITRWSAAIRSYINREWLLPRDYVDVLNGEWQTAIYTRNWPVNSVSQLMMDGTVIPAATTYAPDQRAEAINGWRLEPWDGIPPGGSQAVSFETRFTRGFMNIQVAYNAGYLISNESQTIPATSAPTDPGTLAYLQVDQPYGMWASDVSVLRSDGTPMTRVNTFPTQAGQYQVLIPDQPNPSPPPGIPDVPDPGTYVFYVDDVGENVQISYGYIPAALEQIAIEMILERYVYRTRIGEISRTVAQQVTARYDFAEIPPYAKTTLQAYMHVVPV